MIHGLSPSWLPSCTIIFPRKPGVNNPAHLTASFVFKVNTHIFKKTNEEEGGTCKLCRGKLSQ